ncbi:MAG: family 20 glycosylhydrolase [Lentisphaeria bacterium]|nr:family 20 glycosylhydrolase [Lentisphaeria bacterium]
MMRKFFLALVFLNISLSSVAGAMELTPKPKELSVSGKKAHFSYSWAISGADIFPEAVIWIKEEFSAKKWEIAPEAKQRLILRKCVPQQNKEYYTLSIAEDGVTLEAATPDGMKRAVGRFFSLLKQEETVYSQNTFTMPLLSIRDWPDFPIRTMDLTMAFWEPFDDAERLEAAKNIIRIMSEHGFNYVVIELGGNYVSKYFKAKSRTPWTVKHIRELIRFSNLRGVTAIPGINTIGHLDRAPQICILKNKAGKKIGHDIQKKEFYDAYANVLDELMELFENPPYFRVGGDESNSVFRHYALGAENSAKLYVKVFNFAAEHLEKYNCRPVLWHDMIFANELGGKRVSVDGLSDGKQVIPSKTVLKNLSRKIIVNFWDYAEKDSYPGINILREAGFEVWASTWHYSSAIFALAKYSINNGVAAFDGTTWSNNHTKGGALILVGECAWNGNAGKISFDPDEIFMREWNLPPFFSNVENVRVLKWQNAVPLGNGSKQYANIGNLRLPLQQAVAAAKTDFIKLKQPEEILKQKQLRPDTELFLAGVERYVMRPLINQPRGFNTLVLYTPSWGTSTRQNAWGNDWRVVDGKIIGYSRGVANPVIPSNGCVISAHTTGADIHINAKKLMAGNSVEFIAARPSIAGKLPELTAACNEASTLVLVFGTDLKLYDEQPRLAAEIIVTTENGRQESFRLGVGFPLAPDPNRYGRFQVIYLPRGNAAVIWRGQGEKASGIKLRFSKLGVTIGCKLLNAVQI